MPVRITLRSGVLTALLEGEIDHHTSRKLREEIDQTASRAKPETLVLDFSDVRFMDSSGVGLILGRYRLIQEWGGKLVVSNMPEYLEQIASLAGLEEICTLERRDKHENGNSK